MGEDGLPKGTQLIQPIGSVEDGGEGELRGRRGAKSSEESVYFNCSILESKLYFRYNLKVWLEKKNKVIDVSGLIELKLRWLVAI